MALVSIRAGHFNLTLQVERSADGAVRGENKLIKPEAKATKKMIPMTMG